MNKISIKAALLGLWRQKNIVIINILGLSVGMVTTILISIWIQTELSFDGYHPQVENIYRIKPHIFLSPKETWLFETTQYILGEHAKKEIPEIKTLTRFCPQLFSNITFRYNEKFFSEKKVAFVDEQWFNMFHYDLVDGTFNLFLKNPFSLIITSSTAERYFGTQKAAGKILKIDSVNYQVQAVVKDNPANSSFQYNILIPIAAKFTNKDVRENDLDWGTFNYLTFVKLVPGSDLSSVCEKLQRILKINDKDARATYSLVKIQDMHFENDVKNSNLAHGNKITLKIFEVLALVILIIACINYVNLTTARAIIRSREISIRKIIGAGRFQLFNQFMFESLLITLISLLFALLLVQISFPWYKSFIEMDLPQPLFSLSSWLIICVTLTFSFLLNGIYPALFLASLQPLQIIRGKGSLNFKNSTLRKILVVVQFSMSIVLIIVTTVINKQLRFVENIDLGYDRNEVFSFKVPLERYGFDLNKRELITSTIKEELKLKKGILRVSIGSENLVDFKGQSSGSFDWDGRNKNFNPYFAPLRVDPDFQSLMHLKILEGRWFSNYKTDYHNVVLNETAVQLLKSSKSIIGQRFVHQRDTGVIIGIVKNFHYRSLHEKIGPMVMSYNPGVASTFYIKPNLNHVSDAINSSKKVWERFITDTPFSFEFLDDDYNKLYSSEQKFFTLISLFAGIGIIISTFGLLGMSTFSAEQKGKEISIRRILGAGVGSIIRLLTTDFVKLILISSLIAFPIGWWAINTWLEGFSYRIGLSWWIFITAGSIPLLVTILTISIQVFRFIVVNPVSKLKSE